MAESRRSCLLVSRAARMLTYAEIYSVVSFFGALLGSMVIYTIPALMYRKARGMEIAASGAHLLD